MGDLSPHPYLACLDEIEALLKQAGGMEPVFLPTPHKAAALQRLCALGAELDALRLRVAAVAGDVADDAGARDVASWLAATTPLDPAQARAEVRLAEALEERYAEVADRLARGEVSTAQASVVCRVLDAVPDDVTGAERGRAEVILVDAAVAGASVSELRRLGRRVLELVDPVRFEESEARRLAAEERAAQQRVSLQLRDRGDGTTAVDAVLPTSDAFRLRTYLEAFAQPRKQEAARSGARVPRDRLLGQAFQALLRLVDPGDLPHHGGDATTVMVTMTLDQLRAELGVAGLGFEGEPITAGEARRLACNALIVPVVLGGGSEVLDVGRAARLHTPMQRKAIRLRDRVCRVEGCDVPATWCEVHHLEPWSRGGRTSVDNSALLCGRHHHRAHRPDQRVRVGPTGAVTFHRRT